MCQSKALYDMAMTIARVTAIFKGYNCARCDNNFGAIVITMSVTSTIIVREAHNGRVTMMAATCKGYNYARCEHNVLVRTTIMLGVPTILPVGLHAGRATVLPMETNHFHTNTQTDTATNNVLSLAEH